MQFIFIQQQAIIVSRVLRCLSKFGPFSLPPLASMESQACVNLFMKRCYWFMIRKVSPPTLPFMEGDTPFVDATQIKNAVWL